MTPTDRLPDPRRASASRRMVACLGIAGLAALGGIVGVAGTESMVRAERPEDPSASDCRVRADSSASPILIRLGESVTVRTRLRLDCRERIRPYHLAIAVDAAAVAEDEPGEWGQAALSELADRLDLAANPRARVGVVAFDARARLLCSPTADPDKLDGCLERLRSDSPPAEGFGGLAEAIDEAAKALALTRGAAPPRDNEDPLREEILVLTGAGSSAAATEAYCAGVGRAVSLAREEGIEIGLVCLTGDCLNACLADAVAPGKVEPAAAWPEAAQVYEQRVWSTRTRIRRVTLHEILPAQMQVDMTSFDPAGAIYDTQTHRLRWDLDAAGLDTVRVSYSVRPTLAGTWPVRLSGQVVFVDTQGETGLLTLSVPQVAVVDGEPRRIHLPTVLLEPPTDRGQPFVDPLLR
jgi:hypothetical protein